MERRRKPVSRRSGRRVEPRPASQPDPVRLPLPYIEELIEFGEITVGNKYPIGGVAVASDEHSALAMLVRRDGETLAQLLTRLDQAVAKALDDDIYTDEINPSS
ncbi:MAG: hypothetical protein ABSG62_23480 [Terracidiphilus sp.]